MAPFDALALHDVVDVEVALDGRMGICIGVQIDGDGTGSRNQIRESKISEAQQVCQDREALMNENRCVSDRESVRKNDRFIVLWQD